MILSKNTPAQRIEIWQPRYKDNVVLIAKHKVGTHNEIIFTKAKHLMGTSYYLSDETIRDCPLDSNGRIPCYAVPVDKLQVLERTNNE